HRCPTGGHHGVADVPDPVARDPDRATLPGMSPAHSRRPAHLRGEHFARLGSRWCRRAGAAAAAVGLPRPYRPTSHLLVSLGRAGTARPRRRPDAASPRSDVMTALAPTLQAFFTERLARQKNASPHTVASYRDTLRLLLGFVAKQTGTPPARMQIEDLDAPLIGAFLDHLEDQRANSVRSRNTRLAAIHSLFRFAALQHPEHAALIA